MFRWGKPDDYPAALEIQRRAYAAKEVPLYGSAIPPLFETPESMAAEIAAGKRLMVCECGGRVIASVRMENRHGGGVYFCRLSVDPAWQGRGVGQRLAEAAEAANPEARSFLLDCGEKSGENFHMYRKLGYRETGGKHKVQNGPLCIEMRKDKGAVNV